MHSYICSCNFCILYFVDDVLVFVKTSTKKVTVRAKQSYSIWSLKENVEEETGISAYCQQLKLPGELLPLSDGSRILSNSTQVTLHLETKLWG